MPEHDDAYYQGQFTDRAVNERSAGPQDGPQDEPFTLHFTEQLLADGMLSVEMAIVKGPGFTVHPGVLILRVDEWDRIWRSLVDATGSFDKRGIALVRTHPPSRF